MTFEELQYEAERHGYKLVKQENPVPPDYQRDKKQELTDFFLMTATVGGLVIALCFFLFL
jgi:hypothetical protein